MDILEAGVRDGPLKSLLPDAERWWNSPHPPQDGTTVTGDEWPDASSEEDFLFPSAISLAKMLLDETKVEEKQEEGPVCRNG